MIQFDARESAQEAQRKYGSFHKVGLEAAESRFAAGDSTALVDALKTLAGSSLAFEGQDGLPMPVWLAEPLHMAVSAWINGEAKTLDEALSIVHPQKRSKHGGKYDTPKARAIRRQSSQIFEDVRTLSLIGKYRIGEELYACVASRYSETEVKLSDKDVENEYGRLVRELRSDEPEMSGMLERHDEYVRESCKCPLTGNPKLPQALADHLRVWEKKEGVLPKRKRNPRS
jgi:hypothetical protein